MDKKIPKEKKGFNKLPEAVQEKISPKLAQEFNMGGMVDKRSPFMGGGIAYAGGGRAMKREMYSEGTKLTRRETIIADQKIKKLRGVTSKKGKIENKGRNFQKDRLLRSQKKTKAGLPGAR